MVVLKGKTTTSLLAKEVAVDMGLVARLDEVLKKSIGLMNTSPIKIKLWPEAEPFCLLTARNIPFPMMKL